MNCRGYARRLSWDFHRRERSICACSPVQSGGITTWKKGQACVDIHGLFAKGGEHNPVWRARHVRAPSRSCVRQEALVLKIGQASHVQRGTAREGACNVADLDRCDRNPLRQALVHSLHERAQGVWHTSNEAAARGNQLPEVDYSRTKSQYTAEFRQPRRDRKRPPTIVPPGQRNWQPATGSLGCCSRSD
jgi:hypothetical protein